MIIVVQKTKKTNRNGLVSIIAPHSFTALPINFCSRYISFTDVLYLYFLSLWNQIHYFGVLIVSLSLSNLFGFGEQGKGFTILQCI